jgi:cell division protein FtsL
MTLIILMISVVIVLLILFFSVKMTSKAYRYTINPIDQTAEKDRQEKDTAQKK